MSNLFNIEDEEEESGLVFSKRTTNADFQQRLLKAQEEIEDDFEETLNIHNLDSDSTPESLRQELEYLQQRIKKNKKEITKLETKIQKQQERRKLEAKLTNLTPAERAKRVEKELEKMKEQKQGETEEEDEEPEMDTLFEYILFLSTDSEVADLSKADYLQAHKDIRKKALQDQIIVNESELSGIRFTEVSNEATRMTEDDITIRKCHLVGIAIEKPFSVSFNVTEPIKTVNNLSFDVGIEMQMDISTVLQYISEECNLLTFFRVLVHYAKLENQRNETIKRLKDEYTDSQILVEFLSESKLKFQGVGNSDLYVLLDWRIVEKTILKSSLDSDVLECVVPVFEMEAVSILGSGEHVSDNLTSNLKPIMIERGVFDAIDYFIKGLLT